MNLLFENPPRDLQLSIHYQCTTHAQYCLARPLQKFTGIFQIGSEEGLTLETSAFIEISLRWLINVFNSDVNNKLPVRLSHQRNTTVSIRKKTFLSCVVVSMLVWKMADRLPRESKNFFRSHFNY